MTPEDLTDAERKAIRYMTWGKDGLGPRLEYLGLCEEKHPGVFTLTDEGLFMKRAISIWRTRNVAREEAP